MADFLSDDTQILRDHAHLLFFIWIPSWFATMGCPDRRRRMLAQKNHREVVMEALAHSRGNDEKWRPVRELNPSCQNENLES